MILEGRVDHYENNHSQKDLFSGGAINIRGTDTPINIISSSNQSPHFHKNTSTDMGGNSEPQMTYTMHHTQNATNDYSFVMKPHPILPFQPALHNSAEDKKGQDDLMVN